MAVHNAYIAWLFYRMVELLELQGANPFRVRAYRPVVMGLYRRPRLQEPILGGFSRELLARCPVPLLVSH